MTEAKPGLREGQEAQTRATIRSCALRLIREQGYEATTIEQIAVAADVSEATFFRYFPTKEDIALDRDYERMLIEAFRRTARGQPGAGVADGLRRRLRRPVRPRAGRAARMDRPHLCRPPARSARIGRVDQAMRLIIGAMAERPAARPDDRAVHSIAGGIAGAAITVGTALRDDPDADPAALIDQAIARLDPRLGL